MRPWDAQISLNLCLEVRWNAMQLAEGGLMIDHRKPTANPTRFKSKHDGSFLSAKMPTAATDRTRPWDAQISHPDKHNHKRQDPAPNVHKEMLLAIFIHYEICMSAGAKTENKAKDAHTLKQIFKSRTNGILHFTKTAKGNKTFRNKRTNVN